MRSRLHLGQVGILCLLGGEACVAAVEQPQPQQAGQIAAGARHAAAAPSRRGSARPPPAPASSRSAGITASTGSPAVWPVPWTSSTSAQPPSAPARERQLCAAPASTSSISGDAASCAARSASCGCQRHAQRGVAPGAHQAAARGLRQHERRVATASLLRALGAHHADGALARGQVLGAAERREGRRVGAVHADLGVHGDAGQRPASTLYPAGTCDHRVAGIRVVVGTEPEDPTTEAARQPRSSAAGSRPARPPRRRARCVPNEGPAARRRAPPTAA